jgi:hypothetical protein
LNATTVPTLILPSVNDSSSSVCITSNEVSKFVSIMIFLCVYCGLSTFILAQILLNKTAAKMKKICKKNSKAKRYKLKEKPKVDDVRPNVSFVKNFTVHTTLQIYFYFFLKEFLMF